MADPTNTGIYEIVNVISDKSYIGSAKNIRNRLGGHKTNLKAGRHHSRHLQSAWNKYGPHNFIFRQIIVCRVSELLLYEQAAIDAIRPEYNINQNAENSLGCIRTAVTRAKISAKALGRKYSAEAVEARASKLRGVKLPPHRIVHLYANDFAVGYKHTDEWKRQNSVRHTGRKRPKSPEYRAKISVSLKGITHSVERRAKQAAAQVGLKRKPYNIKPRTPEQTTARIAATIAIHTGRKRSAESVARMSAARKGVKLSAEHAAAIGVASKKSWDRRARDDWSALRPLLFDWIRGDGTE